MENPKLRGRDSVSATWYRYYPGFSERFARSVLSSAALGKGAWVLDPWNGSGTTTSTAAAMGVNVCGYDLNPAMVLVAKARCLDPAEYPSLKPLSVHLTRKAKRPFEVRHDDPLLAWLVPSSVAAARGIEAAIQKLLIDDGGYANISARGPDTISDLAAFFYIALFRTLRNILRPFRASNPTWVKRPDSKNSRLRPSGEILRSVFRAELREILPAPIAVHGVQRAKRVLKVGSSENLPLEERSIDIVLASPPYCTRIDYAVATSAELALLGFGSDAEFNKLRRELIGSTTVPKILPETSDDWGTSCLSFLEKLRVHSSKASATYYYKNHLQYFRSMSTSIGEINRVLKPGGTCVLVVQDSYYKDLHNDLPAILTDMAGCKKLNLEKSFEFPLSRTLAGINPRSNGYRTSFGATESVLVFRKATASGAEEINNVANIVKPVGCDVLRPSG
jgi:SAM-dependent methyltransferase